MTSKNSFLVSSKENHKRRIWVWLISILVQALFYPGVMIVYLSRINAWNKGGKYSSVELFQKALQEAAADAVGFNPNAVVPITLLGILIAVQGFSYLHDRKKVDMYQSVPVSRKKRFAIIYINGIAIYALPALAGVVTALLIGTAQGAVTGSTLAECALAFFVDLLYFLAVYHISILAVMLTGHIIITGFAVVTLLFVLYAGVQIASIMKELFFDRVDYFFRNNAISKYSIVTDYLRQVRVLRYEEHFSEIAASSMLVCAKWLAGALVILALAYFCYLKRPAEAAGTAVSFRIVKPFVKVIISVMIALAAYWIVRDATYENLPVSLLGMIGAAVICCAVMESIFEFDIHAAIKHLASTGIAVALSVLIFCIYQFDLFGYDSYIPDADKVASVALDIGSYQRYWEYSEVDEWARLISYYSNSDYLRNNMFLTDIDAVCELARKGLEIEEDDLPEIDEKSGYYKAISVLYRLKSGREVSRTIMIDWNDASNEALLDRLVGTQEYREGYYQLVKNEIPYSAMRKNLELFYTNGALECELPPMDAEALREAWLKDMEQFTFSMAKNNRICGVIKWDIESQHTGYELPVYESFTNTIAFLKERDAYYPLQLRAEDIKSIEITNYHYDYEEYFAKGGTFGSSSSYYVDKAVTKYFEDTEEIAEIVEAVYPNGFDVYWNAPNPIDTNYDIIITFKADTGYPYGRGYFYYEFLKGQVPDFVVEATAYEPGEN